MGLRVHPGMNLMAPPWFFPGVVGSSLHTSIPPKKGTSRRINRSNSDGSRGTAPNRPSAPPPTDSDGDEMGMSLERQREIQASLFRILGQADDVATSNSGKSSKPARATSNHSSLSHDENVVNGSSSDAVTPTSSNEQTEDLMD